MSEPVSLGDATLYLGDCLEVMRSLPECSVDSIVTDPPYGIGFMGKSWDGADIKARAERRRGFESHAPDAGPNGGHKSMAAQAGLYDLSPTAMRAFQNFSHEWAIEAFRVLKPGGHLLSFASTRSYHRMTCGIEDAGFEIRDQIGWAFGSGFPKSKNLEGDWDGWGSNLKPGWEPICVARKPFKGTLEANVLANGVGALNIDGCRIHAADALGGSYTVKRFASGASVSKDGNWKQDIEFSGEMKAGRWPGNLLHDGSEEVLACFPEAPGQLADASINQESRKNTHVYGSMKRGREPSADSENEGTVGFKMKPGARRLDTGSAARFFYCAKTSRADRHEGLPDPGTKFTHGGHIREVENAGADRGGNHHPTVKPTDLMAYLLRLVTPPDGVALDPFMGSGSTGKAALLEGFRFIGIEREVDYFAIAKARIDYANRTHKQERMFA